MVASSPPETFGVDLADIVVQFSQQILVDILIWMSSAPVDEDIRLFDESNALS